MKDLKLTEEQILKNKEEFLSILEEAVTSRENANWNGLKNQLISSDFFTAPASTKYHSAFKGGLCWHSLNVYKNLVDLIKMKGFEDKYDNSCLAIVSLLHDFSKMNFYKDSYKNTKVYSEFGTKHDEAGRYDWVAEKSYVVRPDDEKTFLIGSHEENSEYMVSYFIPLSIEESAAILNHHGGMGYDSKQDQAMKVMNRYFLVLYLHTADMLATYSDEVTHE